MKSLLAITLQALGIALFTTCTTAQTPKNNEIVIVIDPGHGGSSNTGAAKKGIQSLSKYNNAWTASGLLVRHEKDRPHYTWEKNLALELSKQIQKMINEAGSNQSPRIVAKLTREVDKNPTMKERAAIAAENSASSFVSIHFNASKAHSVSGTEAFVQAPKRNQGNDDKHVLDRSFAEGLVTATRSAIAPFYPDQPRRYQDTKGVATDVQIGMGMQNNEILGSHLFHHLGMHSTLSKTRACFLEIEYIDNPKVDAALFADGKWKTTFPPIAKAIAEQLIRWHKEHP